jgi:hypothetical protein
MLEQNLRQRPVLELYLAVLAVTGGGEGYDTSFTHRKPMLPVEESRVLELLAATR